MGRYKNTGLFAYKVKIEEDFNTDSNKDEEIKEFEESLKENEEDIEIESNKNEEESELKKEYSLKEGIKELEKAKVKFNNHDVIFVIKDEFNQLIWLEKGNKNVGYKHILKKHKKQFLKAGFKMKEMLPLIKSVLFEGEILYQRKTVRQGRTGYERLCKYKDKYFIFGIGLNGFVISMYLKK